MNSLSSSYHAVENQVIDYYRAIPSNTIIEIVKGSAFAFLAGVFLSEGNIVSGTAYGVFAATATTIYALVTPLFKKFTERHRLKPLEEIFRGAIGIVGAHLIISAAGFRTPLRTLQISLLVLCILTFVVDNRRRLDRTNAIYV